MFLLRSILFAIPILPIYRFIHGLCDEINSSLADLALKFTMAQTHLSQNNTPTTTTSTKNTFATSITPSKNSTSTNMTPRCSLHPEHTSSCYVRKESNNQGRTCIGTFISFIISFTTQLYLVCNMYRHSL